MARQTVPARQASLSSSRHGELSDRLTKAFQAEELVAAKRAIQVSLVAFGGIAALVAVQLPLGEAVFYFSVLATFSVLVVIAYTVRNSRFAQPWHGYLFALALYALFAFSAFVPNPLAEASWPPQMQHRLGLFVYSFVFLVPFVFTYSPLLMFWAGLACVLCWGAGTIWLFSLPMTQTARVISGPWTLEKDITAFLDRYYVHTDIFLQDIVVMLIVAAALAAVVARTRKIVLRQATAERDRANLACYFPPSVVDRLAERDEHLGAARAQPVAVLFADIVGFTRLAEHTNPDGLVSLLRSFHERLERVVFDHGGTLDKFLGDGIMATFGTPENGPHDALDAVTCAKAMLDTIDDWNNERGASGAPPIRLSIGIHYGKAVLGNIGSERRLEFAVIGDVVNVASRLEDLTRPLDCRLVVGEDLMRAAREQAGDRFAELLEGFSDRGIQAIRGRDEGVRVWSLARS